MATSQAKQLNQNLFGKDELADEAEVEKLETQPQQAEPAPPPEPQPKPKPEGQPPEGTPAEGAAEKPHEEAVPYERFKALNETKNKLEEELAQHREWRTRLDERQRVIKEATEQQQRAAEQQRRAAERPDPGLDPIGAELYDLRAEHAQNRQVIEQLQNQLNTFGQTYQTNQEQSQFSNWVTNEANSYAQQDAAYFPAAKYAADKRIAFWKAITPNAPPELRLAEKLVEGESILIARLAQQYGGRFAPTVAQLAREWGFNPQAVAQAAGNGQMRPSQGPPQAGSSPQAQRLAQVQGGQRLQGLGAVPAANNAPEGASAYRNYSKVDIANMSEREFMQAMANPQTARDLKYALAKADELEGQEVNY